jgi:hypothetical protein
MPNTHLIAVDTGSLFTKIKGVSRQLCVPSAVVASGGISADRVHKGRVSWRQDGKDMEFTVGWDVRSFFGSSNAADTSVVDWAGSDPWKALMYYALSELDAKNSVQLLVSSTYKDYSADRAKITEIMNGKHTFIVDEKNHSVDVSTTVLPQAVGAHSNNRKNSNDSYQMVATIEIGHNTTDIIAYEQDVPFRDHSGTCKCGTSNVIELLKSNLRNQYGCQPDYLDLHDILAKQVINYEGNQIDLCDEIRVLAATVFDPIVEFINQQWRTQHYGWQVFVGGGGGAAFVSSLKTLVPHAELIKGGMFSVVEGMYRYGQMNRLCGKAS